MNVKSIVTVALSVFIVVSVAVVLKRQAAAGRVAEPAVAQGRTQPVSAPLPAPDESGLPERAAQAENEAAPVVALPSSPPPVEPPEEAPVSAATPSALNPVSEAAPVVRLSKRRVLAFYFHGDFRCAACRTIEILAREAVEEGYPDRVADGSVVFESVNVERAENRHFISDFNLVTRSVVIAEEVDGVVGRWARLDAVWQYVGRRTRYLEYVRGVVDEFLEPGMTR